MCIFKEEREREREKDRERGAAFQQDSLIVDIQRGYLRNVTRVLRCILIQCSPNSAETGVESVRHDAALPPSQVHHGMHLHLHPWYVGSSCKFKHLELTVFRQIFHLMRGYSTSRHPSKISWDTNRPRSLGSRVGNTFIPMRYRESYRICVGCALLTGR